MPDKMSKREEQELRRLLDGIEVYVPEEKAAHSPHAAVTAACTFCHFRPLRH